MGRTRNRPRGQKPSKL